MAVTYDFQTPGVSTSAADTQEDIRNIAEMSWVWHVNASPHTLTNKPTGLIEAFYYNTVDFTSFIPSYGYQNYFSLKAYDGTNLGNVNFGDLWVHYDGAVLSNTIGARGEEFISMGVYAGYSCEDSASWIINADVGNSGSSGYDPILAFKNQTTERARIYTDTSDSHKLKFDVGGSDQMVIDSSGNVGIGESSPDDLLHIKNSSTGSNAGLRLENDDQTWALYCRGFDSDKFKIQDIDANTSPFIIETTAPNNTLYLDSSGNVGIGTSAPDKKLHVDGSTDGVVCQIRTADHSTYIWQAGLDIAHRSDTTISAGSATSIAFVPLASTGSSFYGSASIKGVIENATANNQDTALTFWTRAGASNSTADTEKMRIDSSGNVEVNTGNLVIGTSGKGIDFSATSGTGTSELLDDYEEGTFTPTLVTTGTNFTSVGYRVSTKGRYTKIGNTVHVYIRLATDSVNKGSGAGAATGEVAIGGLPFTCNSEIYLNYPVSVLTANWSANPPAGAQVIHNTKLIYLYQNQGSTGDITNTSVSDVGTGTANNDVTIVGTYRV